MCLDSTSETIEKIIRIVKSDFEFSGFLSDTFIEKFLDKYGFTGLENLDKQLHLFNKDLFMLFRARILYEYDEPKYFCFDFLDQSEGVPPKKVYKTYFINGELYEYDIRDFYTEPVLHSRFNEGEILRIEGKFEEALFVFREIVEGLYDSYSSNNEKYREEALKKIDEIELEKRSIYACIFPI